jgi:hypothetical protein
LLWKDILVQVCLLGCVEPPDVVSIAHSFCNELFSTRIFL